MADIFLLPGEYRLANRSLIIETLVGSCVSVCLYNIKNGQAAMNHFLHDVPRDKSCYNIGLYGSSATEYIVKALMKLDPIASNYRAQIFGGATVIKTTCNTQNIGQKNIDISKKILSDCCISIIREEIGGKRGRRIKFDTATNDVFCRFAGQVGKKYQQEQQSV